MPGDKSSSSLNSVPVTFIGFFSGHISAFETFTSAHREKDRAPVETRSTTQVSPTAALLANLALLLQLPKVHPKKDEVGLILEELEERLEGLKKI